MCDFYLKTNVLPPQLCSYSQNGSTLTKIAGGQIGGVFTAVTKKSYVVDRDRLVELGAAMAP